MMGWENILKAEAEAETALAAAMKNTQEMIQEFQRWKDSETQSQEHPNFKGQNKRIQPQFLINTLSDSLQHLQTVQMELRKPPAQQPEQVGTGQPIQYGTQRVE